jgi:hypothetical protein
MLRFEDETVPAVDQPVAANDNGPVQGQLRRRSAFKATRAVHVHANDNSIALVEQVAANDNEAILVVDDLSRPLPIMRGEGDLIRTLLGERFRQILLEGEAS